ncbi:hypothetical protein [Mesorhizobium sp. B2-1-3]|uniref:hypothetical protein n=1 Tax=Mesorhizobium sp. B2-1-3 TaxID=2589972 RepID=UPI0015E46C8A|nr:hypothetical protein [Mesorhizobium sp. B2-1-3]
MLVATHDVSTRTRARLIGCGAVSICADILREVEREQRATYRASNQTAKKIPKIEDHVIPPTFVYDRFACLLFCEQQFMVMHKLAAGMPKRQTAR